VVRGDVDEGVGFVPGGEVGVDVALYRAQGAGDEGEDAGDFVLDVFVPRWLASCEMKRRWGRYLVK